MPITPGLVHEMTITVTPEMTAAASNVDGMAPVLSTPRMIGLMEQTAHRAILPLLEPGQSSVGTLVNIRHLTATPVGMQVRLRAELLEVDGRRLRFRVEAWDEQEKIGEGEHERFVIDYARFMGRVEKKRG